MRKCQTCEKYLEDSNFEKNGLYLKSCERCRGLSRTRSQKARDKNPEKGKDYYLKNATRIKSENKEKRSKDPYRFMLYAARRRAKLNNLEIDITAEYIKSIYPKDNKCPIFNVELSNNDIFNTDCSPSLDRLDPKNGYIKGNVAVISYRANRIKNDATLEELQQIVIFLKKWQTQ